MLRRSLALLAASVAMCVVAACGVPGTSDFQGIDPDEVPAILSESTSTTSTATSRPPRTTPATTSTPISAPTTSTTSTVAPTSTTTAVYDVSLFFVVGPGQLTPITRQLASPAPGQVLAALADGVPVGTEYDGLTTALPEDDPDVTVGVDGGRATVELPPEFLVDTPTSDQSLAIAQIVLTLTTRPGIGQVTFVSDGEPIPVSKGDGSLTNPGADVVCEDYRTLAPAASCG